MQFYKFEGVIASQNAIEENGRAPQATYSKCGEISVRSSLYNEKLNKKAFFFISAVSENTVTVGAILNGTGNIDKMLESFLKTVKIELEDIYSEEITSKSIKNMLQVADRSDYIEDHYEVFEQYELDNLDSRFIRNSDFSEGIIEEHCKSFIYDEAKKLPINVTFVPELDRIYSGSAMKNASGHPVHYIVQTDKAHNRDEICALLFGALYANGRLKSKRYTFLTVDADDSFSIATYDSLYKSCIGGAIVLKCVTSGGKGGKSESDAREVVKKMCNIMKKYRNRVLTVLFLPDKAKKAFFENACDINFIELKEEPASAQRAKEILKAMARENRVRTDKKLFAKLDPSRTYPMEELQDLFDTWYDDKIKTVIYPQYGNMTTAECESAKESPDKTSYDELMEMVGLDEVKKIINNALNYFKMQKILARRGIKAGRPTMNMVFSGNPGTAKTSVARLFAKIMKENGILKKDSIVEVGRGDLVGRYVGWTAPAIQKLFAEAEGGVLFIDEAYSLVDGHDGSFGDEAINTIVQEMENHRESVAVIFAGYPDKMKYFIDKNPGLKSRIAYFVMFDDYSTSELCDIAKLIASKKGLCVTEEATEKLASVFNTAKDDNDFGNGRYVRNVIEKAEIARATRLLAMNVDSVTNRELTTICADDIEIPPSEKKARKTIGFSA